MQAPLRKGKKEETLGRAEGLTRTGRSLLFGLLLIAMATVSSLVYTWERVVVESMLKQNGALAKNLDMVEKRSQVLAYDVACLESWSRIVPRAEAELGMAQIDWHDVVVIEQVREKR